MTAGRKIQPMGRGLKTRGLLCPKQSCYFPKTNSVFSKHGNRSLPKLFFVIEYVL
jgi:hypothetical protein